MILKILYWNLKRKGIDLISQIQNLAQDIDILILSELKMPKDSFNTIIQEITSSTTLEPIGKYEDKKDWMVLFVHKKRDYSIEFINSYDELKEYDLVGGKDVSESFGFADYLQRKKRMLFFKITYEKKSFILGGVHFPSKMYTSSIKQKDIAVQFKRSIDKIETKLGLSSIIIGDFNMNPFELGMVHREGFHALSSLELSREKKSFYSNSYSPFYNPSWFKLGDIEFDGNEFKERPSGSFFSKGSSDIEYYWYLFDQIILRHNLAQYFDFQEFEYLTMIGEKSLLNDDLTPNDKEYSDHLPLKIALKL